MISEKIKAIARDLKRKFRKAEEASENERWKRAYSKFITPSRIEVFDTNLLFDQRTYVRCLVCGLPRDQGGEGYPRDLTSKAIERIQELSFEGCKIMLSHGLIQISGGQAKEDLKRASLNINMEQRARQTASQGPDLELMCKTKDITANYKQLYFKNQRSYHSSFLIVIMGGEKEVFTAESYIISILKSELIEVQIPAGRQLEMFLSALPFPVSDSKAWVEVRSDTAAVLCTSTNLNSRTDERGLYFGKDLKTNNEILIDLDTLAAKHLTLLGCTGAGKTFAFLLLLMRMHDMQGARIVYTTPKADTGTDYRAVASYYGPKACIADIGEGKASINPLQILFDSVSMGESRYAYARAYDRHKKLIMKFFQTWFVSGLTDNQRSYLDESLDECYEQAGIYRDEPETWKKPFPVMRNLRAIWGRDLRNKDLGTKALSAEAMFNKTYDLEGSYTFLNSPSTEIDLSKDFIIIDISGIPEEIKDALAVFVSGAISSRFVTDSEKDTIIAVDEAAVYLRDPELSGSLLKTLTQGRSHRVYLWLATHQPSDFAKNHVREEYKTNMFVNIVLGHNLKNAINDVKEYFELTEEEAEDLATADQGEGLLIVKDERIPIFFESTELEKAIIKGTYQEKVSIKALADGAYMLLPEYKDLIEEQKIILNDWIQGDSSQLLKQGYEKHLMQRIGETGRVAVFFPLGMVQDGFIKLPGIGDHTKDHYSSVVQLAALLQEYGFDEIHIDHNQEMDISAKIHGKKIAFEYENYNNKNPDIIIKKKAAALETHNEVWFICSSQDQKHISGAVGEYCTVVRGAAVRELLASYQSGALNPDIHNFEMVIET